ncbi:ABC-three component system middle component 1 [Vibrio sp. E150_018]
MNKDFLKIMSKLLQELELHAGMLSLDEDSITTLKSQNLILVRRGNVGDYFLIAEIQESELNSVNRDLQTSLMLRLNSLNSDTDINNLQPLSGVLNLNIDNNYEKNTTLLLFVQQENNVDKLVSKITEVEEDEYFFKKQVVLLSAEFLSKLGSEVSKSTDFEVIKYLQDLMNNTIKFKQFMEKPNADTYYSGCAQLFEKLPFLHMIVESSESNSLQNMIDSEIAENSEIYGITSNPDAEDDSTLTILYKNLKDISEAALKYASKAEHDNVELEAEALLTEIQGNKINE